MPTGREARVFERRVASSDRSDPLGVDVSHAGADLLAEGSHHDAHRVDQHASSAVRVAALVGSRDVAGVLDRPGPQQRHPVVLLQRTSDPRRRHHQDVGSVGGQGPGEFGEPQVVTGDQAQPVVTDGDGQRIAVAGCQPVGLAVSEGVVEVDLAVAAGQGAVGSYGDKGVVRPVGIGVAGLEHPGDHDRPELSGQGGDAGHERAVERLGRRGQWHVGLPEVVHAGFRTHDQVRFGSRGTAHELAERLQVGRLVQARRELHQCDTHGDSLPCWPDARLDPVVEAEGSIGPAYDVIVLAGGSARRLGGVDKVLLPVAGRPMLERVLAAAAGGRTITVVGPERAMPGLAGPAGQPGSIRWVRERPVGSGPLAALAAGLAGGEAPMVVVLAADMPMVDADVVARLVSAAGAGDADGVDGVDGAVLVDADGRTQPLAAAYLRSALDHALAAIGDPAHQAMRLLLARLRVAHVTDPTAALDCDTADDLAAADRLARPAGHHDSQGR